VKRVDDAADVLNGPVDGRRMSLLSVAGLLPWPLYTGREAWTSTLINRHIYNTFQPLLYQVATATLNPGDITWFLRPD